MNNHKSESLERWTEEIMQYHFPRWEDLPDIDLYMDQVLTLIDKYLHIFQTNEEKNILTSSMINNYVKLKMIPKPIKKRYTKKHLAYLIAITVLKQVLTIPEIKKGILLQANVNGMREAYNLFCTEQEYALKAIASTISEEKKWPLIQEDTNKDNRIVRNAALAVAAKIVTEKILSVMPVEENGKEENRI
ncbi:DUF1836 domain-containing protein [Pisciglobus halotolerans]|uniref:DUF1836 domain-containing protein n=1 Tax=Pisciglobus halotolerans TaxID=745365 RepID=A0A1I3BY87_9LACT|nr:DUF1836 domain-containing protein [Pisciglobus halotolerans]SFH67265.1 protein of unknown function [Pisciglobus halotolerans]